MDANLKIKANAIIQSIHLPTGKVTKETRVHNLITNVGLNAVADLIAGFSSDVFEYVAIGTDNTAPNASDTALGTEVQRQQVTPTDEGTGIIKFDHTFTFGSAESYTITEYGIFNSATLSGSLLFNRLTDSGHAVDLNNGVRVVITINCTNV